MYASMVTTLDNPYDFFTDFDAWYAYDLQQGHHTLSYLGRMVQSSHELSELDQLLELERVVDLIVKENVTGLYVKITKELTDV